MAAFVAVVVVGWFVVRKSRMINQPVDIVRVLLIVVVMMVVGLMLMGLMS